MNRPSVGGLKGAGSGPWLQKDLEMTTSVSRQVIKAVVADDDRVVKRRLVGALSAVWPELQILEVADGIDAWDAYLEHEPAICFLDMRMPGLTGIEVAQRISGRAVVVFLADGNDRALSTFESDAVLHLVKPLDEQRIAEVVTRVQAALAPQQRALLPSLHQLLDKLASQLRRPEPLEVIGTSDGPLQVEEIIYLEADPRGTRIMSQEGETLVHTPLKELVAQLDPAVFLQVNRFAVVHQRYIEQARRLEDETMVLSLREQDKTLSVAPHFQAWFGRDGLRLAG